MNAVDTNVLIYRLDRRERVKRAKARDLVRQLATPPGNTVLLWQVAGELLRQLRSWQDQGRITRVVANQYFAVYRQIFPLVLPKPSVLDWALFLGNRYSLSHWDSMLLAACIECGVDTLYTEDMGAPVRIETVQLINPFI